MSTQHDRDWEDCPLCGGAGEVSISKDGTYEGTDYYGCPMCISRERDEEARLIETQRDELRAVNTVLEMAARHLLEAVEDFEGYRQDIDTAIADLREALDRPKQDLDPAAIVRAAEREACVKVCVDISKDYWMGDCQFEAATRCANAIRARNTNA